MNHLNILTVFYPQLLTEFHILLFSKSLHLSVAVSECDFWVLPAVDRGSMLLDKCSTPE
jgi:hypothetical protein